MAGKKGQKKRLWSDDEKRSICEQTLNPSVSVAQVARRYSMNANLIFKWLKDARFAPIEGAALEGVFLPVEIDGSPMESATSGQECSAADNLGSAASAQRVDITLSDGRRILVEGPTGLSSVLRLVQGLMA
ncbi:IS66-like element accessory protein TnpA [Roseicitreum antarcticum]|jgi:transposase|uniref:IS66-like element accessory protein TnpA n=1 Tax=Roseicitreum antarcticum TaxID=564137 RepID=UPI001680499E|nr:transposase [Roseicitreum antarcticum]